MTHRLPRPALSLALLPLAAALASTPAAAMPSVQLDGAITSAEWRASELVCASEQVTLRVRTAPDALYIAVQTPAEYASYVDLYFDDGSGTVRNLHASQKLGERRIAGAFWDDAQPPFAGVQPGAWRANLGTPQPHGSHDGYEFRVSRSWLGAEPTRLRVEVRDFAGRQADLVLPEGSSRTRPARWIELPRTPRAIGYLALP